MAPQVSDSAPVADPPRVDRRHELDAIRLLVVLGLVFFHTALVFDAHDDFYVKNPQTTEAITWLVGLGVVWGMPALFLIAGLGSWHSLRRRGAGGFARERLLRLGLPLVFATLTILPIPQRLRLKAAEPGYHEPYPRFLLRFFDVHIGLSDFPSSCGVSFPRFDGAVVTCSRFGIHTADEEKARPPGRPADARGGGRAQPGVDGRRGHRGGPVRRDPRAFPAMTPLQARRSQRLVSGRSASRRTRRPVPRTPRRGRRCSSTSSTRLITERDEPAVILGNSPQSNTRGCQ